MAPSWTHFSTSLQKFESNLWGFHIGVPTEVAEPFCGTTDRRVVCRLNDVHEFQCALMPKGDGSYFININKAVRDKLQLKEGAAVEAALRKDESEYGLPMPDELAELLDQDEAAHHYFHALSAGKQRSLLHLIGLPKSSDTRLRRALAVTEFLKANQGKFDFKAFNSKN